MSVNIQIRMVAFNFSFQLCYTSSIQSGQIIGVLQLVNTSITWKFGIHHHVIDLQIHIANTQQHFHFTTNRQTVIDLTRISQTNFTISINIQFLTTDIVVAVSPVIFKRIHLIQEGKHRTGKACTYIRTNTNVERPEVLSFIPSGRKNLRAYVHIQIILIFQTFQKIRIRVEIVAIINNVDNVLISQ